MNTNWISLGRAIVDLSKISAITCAVPEGENYRLYLIIDTVELELPRVSTSEVTALLASLGVDWDAFSGRNQRSAPSTRAYPQ